jgi:hypothetical protein
MARERAKRGYVYGSELRWNIDDDLLEQRVVVCRPSEANRWLKRRPAGERWGRLYFEALNVVVFVEDLVMTDVLQIAPKHMAKLAGERREWERLLEVPVEVGSAQGRG